MYYTQIVTRLDKHVSAAASTHESMEELLYAVFAMRSVSYEVLSMKWKESRLLIISRICLICFLYVEW
jgi:hypothetical protein